MAPEAGSSAALCLGAMPLRGSAGATKLGGKQQYQHSTGQHANGGVLRIFLLAKPAAAFITQWYGQLACARLPHHFHLQLR
jgi:hypothetical protein